jgi:PAS domain S-box-containing protein
MTMDRSTPPPDVYRVLVIDDNPAIHADFRKILVPDQFAAVALDEAEAVLFGEAAAVKLRTRFRLESAYQGQEGLEKVQSALEQGDPFSVAFVDVRMPPGWDGLETISRIWKIDPSLQMIICTAYSDYSWDEMRTRLGESDSAVILKKPFDNIEAIQLTHALAKKWVLSRQADKKISSLEASARQQQQQLTISQGEVTNLTSQCAQVEERFGALFRASPVPLAIQTAADQCFTDVNESFAQLTGFPIAEMVGRTPDELGLWPGEEATAVPLQDRERDCGRIDPSQTRRRIRTKSGETRTVLVKSERTSWNGQPINLFFIEGVSY